jgi:hypothetical protein
LQRSMLPIIKQDFNAVRNNIESRIFVHEVKINCCLQQHYRSLLTTPSQVLRARLSGKLDAEKNRI